MHKHYQKDVHLESTVAPFSRIEVLEGPTGRRKWPIELKLRLVAESNEPGAQVCEVARRNGLRPQHLSTWRRLVREGQLGSEADADFALVSFEDVAPLSKPTGSAHRLPTSKAAACEAFLHIESDGVTVRLPLTSPAARVAELAAALRAAR